ncbi:MAG TPA: DUF6691 family protein [Solirubrobacteraceae bacterium]|nr:DUF6691 family protein [Solirubrobacteraceae bacterium]
MAGALVGVVFGVVMSWSGMADPAVIREALLFQDAYLYGMFASAVLTAAIGVRVLARVQRRAVVTREPITLTTDQPERRHVTGALLFGAGWGVANVCPGPVAAQLGQGVAWSLITAVGVVAGVWLYLRRSGALETEPAAG